MLGQPDMRYMWHEASPYFDTPVALYGYDYANRDYASRDYTNRRFGMEFASRFSMWTGVLRNGGERHNVRRHAENGKNKNGGIPTFFHARYNKTN